MSKLDYKDKAALDFAKDLKIEELKKDPINKVAIETMQDQGYTKGSIINIVEASEVK